LIKLNTYLVSSEKVLKIMNICDPRKLQREEKCNDLVKDMKEEFEKFGRIHYLCIIKPIYKKLGGKNGV